MAYFTFYEVGGCVRDELMGIQSKDIDYTVVPTDQVIKAFNNIDTIFNVLEKWLTYDGYTIWLSTPSCFTIRAKFPENHPKAGITADFVLSRKETGYVPGTRQPIIEAGTLFDDLQRRDFTCNAIAKDEQGIVIDPFNGVDAIKKRILITPLPVDQTFNDDPLRILRAIRFSVTKQFKIPFEMREVIQTYPYKDKMKVVSEERIREELYKAFKHDTLLTMALLCDYPRLSHYIFDQTKLWLKPTTEV